MKSKIIMLVISFALIICCVSCARVESGEIAESGESMPTASDSQSTHDSDGYEPVTAVPQSASKMPDQSFLGVWYTDEYKTDDILIYEITANSVKFNTGAFKLFGFDATATETDGKLLFGYDNSIYGGLKGRLEFEENCVTVIYDDFGNFEDYNSINNVYKFTIKDSNSDYLVKQHNEVKTGVSVKPVDDKERIIGKYTWVSDSCDEALKAHPEYIPAITFNNDNTCEMLVNYIGGKTLLPGVYTIEDNKIFVEVDPSGTPVGGIIPNTDQPYMDDKYVFEIIDYDHLTFCPAEGSYYNDCYIVRNGDPFERQ